MRSEQEIREALELCKQSEAELYEAIIARDATVEALRFCLGIDDSKTSPMTFCFKELLDNLKRKSECKKETNPDSGFAVTE